MSLKARITILFGSFFAVILAAFLFLLIQKSHDEFNGFYNVVDIPDFTLTDHNGGKISLSDYHGKLVLLNFGYTSCPDICPTTLTKLKAIYNDLGPEQENVQVLFVSIDPERDSIEKLKHYVPFFHKDFIGLTGSDEDLNKVADSFNFVFFKEGVNPGNDYLMSHPTSIYLINEEGKLILKYPHSSKREFLLSDINNLL